MGRQGRSWLGGMTLVELMVVLALAAVMVTLGIPALSGMVDSMRLTAGTNTFFSSLMLARSEAANRPDRVVLCKSPSGVTCTQNGGWEQGWIVFHDANNNAAVDAGEEILSREAPLHPDVRLTGNANVASYISYATDGSTQLISGAFQSGTLTVCVQSAGPAAARQIVLYKTGRPRIVKTTVDPCG